ncbi:MAG TPA: elongation factor G [Candidatus Hypogeohydataceae bacterium YC38]|nr:elongation factor G [Candidatus Brocadiales bacterium]
MALYQSKDIRNVALLGHGASGKTTLIEAMLFKSGAIPRMGSVEEGNSVADFEPEEKERKFTVNAKPLPIQWQSRMINAIDTPGYPDFISQAICALSAVETGVLAISATGGIQVNTRKFWSMAEEKGLARIIVITRLDGENIDFPKLLESIQEAFGHECIPLNLPIGCGQGLKGVLSTLELPGDIPKGVIGDPGSTHEALVERVIEVDDEVIQRYLEGKEVGLEEIKKCLSKAVAQGHLIPILCTSSKKLVGVEELLNFAADFAPSPLVALRKGLDIEKGEAVEVKALEDAPFSAQVFKCITDPFVGKLTFFRVFSGVLDGDLGFYNSHTKKNERAGQIFKVFGKDQQVAQRAVAGDIIAMSKVEAVNISDTLCSPKRPLRFDPISFPSPMVSLAVEPKSQGAEQKLSGALAKLAEEDPTFRVTRDSQTGELVVTGISNLHLYIMLNRLKRRFDVEVNTREPKIPYKETVTAKSDAQYKHKKQTGGRGQYGEVYIRMEPLPRGQGFEFLDDVVGGRIPGQYIPAVEKGIRETLTRGILAGYPIVDVRVALYDGSFHTVDSSEAAFKLAASKAFQKAFMEAKPVLLEPIVNIEITIPPEFMGEVSGNLTSRRGRIIGMDSLGHLQVIKASIPMAEVTRYETELKSMTGGQGSYTVEFSHYDVVPAHIAQTIIAQGKKEEKEEK